MSDNNTKFIDSIKSEWGEKGIQDTLNKVANQGYKIGFEEAGTGWGMVLDIARCIVFYVIARKFLRGELDGVFLVFLALFGISFMIKPQMGKVKYDVSENKVVPK